jgi:hypothetical protein
MFRIVLPVLIAAMAAAVPAAAQDANAPQPTAEKPIKEKKVCKTDVGTGSIMPKRTCRTKAEWEALTEQSKGNLDRTQDANAGVGMVGGNRGQ